MSRKGNSAKLIHRLVKSSELFFCSLAIIAVAFSPIKTLGNSGTDGLNIVISPPIIRYTPGSTLSPLASYVPPYPGYVPTQIRKAYSIDQLSNTGAGVTIAIIDAYGSPTIQSDLNLFNTTYNLPALTITIAQPGGAPPVDAGWASETALDVEWVHAIAPQANILLVEAKSATLANLLVAVDYATANGASFVSMSWGTPEFSGSSTYDSHFNHAGITYLASTGDSGTEVEWPAVSPYVVAVGGTTLTTLSDGTYVSESGWSGSGGGTSVYVARPSYQNGFQSATNRGVPDVSFDADPASGVAVYDTTGSGGWAQYGGTSLSAPCWAGLFSLLGQSGPNWLYSEATPSSAYAANYNDVTTGSNGLSAGIGYDLVTGLGTPKANSLIGFSINTASPLTPGDVGFAYSKTLVATGGSGTGYTWSITSGTLPIGLSLEASTGIISGTPTAAGGPTSITFKVTDSVGGSATKSLSITINAAPAISTTSLPDGEATAPYSQTLSVSGGSSPFTWSIMSGSLPTGLSLAASTGIISGTPTTAGRPTSVTFKVTDTAAGTASKILTINIIPAPIFTSAIPPSAWDQNLLFTPYTVTASGGTGTRTFSATGLPTGLSINASSGVISGTPTTTGNFTSAILRVTDSVGGTGTQAFSMTINPLPTISTTSTLPAGDVGVAYSKTLVATGGSGTGYTWSITSGSLPDGLSLAPSTGIISGTPTTAGGPTFITFKVTDSIGGSVTKALSITINIAPTISTTSPLPGGEVTAPYSRTLAATAGTSPFTWSITSGTLPAGLSLNASTGVISGTPTAVVASTNITFKVTDNAGGTASKILSIATIAGPSISTTSPLPGGEVTAPYSATLVASGGSGIYATWAVTVGSLPTGLTIHAETGVIDGIPTTVSNPTFSIRVTDSAGGTVTKVFTLNVVAGPNISTASPLLQGTLGFSYSQTLTANGGVSPYTWSIVAGILPPGLSLDALSGAIIGTPTTPGPYAVTFKVNDSAGGNISKILTIQIDSSNMLCDYDGDGKTDAAIYRPSTGFWYINQTSNGQMLQYGWGGATGDIPVPGDYDGDGKTDAAIYRPSTGFWYINQTSNGQMLQYGWGGATGDIPVPGDYDGDGKTDAAIYRPYTGFWYINQTSNGQMLQYGWGGATGDIPVPGDYDGDGKTDAAIYRPSTGYWYINQTSNGQMLQYGWGGATGDIPVPGDYDGDGKTDAAIYRPSTGFWYINQTSNRQMLQYGWGGATGDIPVPGDYDGDGKTDAAIYRSSTGYWYINQTSNGQMLQYGWGLSTDIPLPGYTK